MKEIILGIVRHLLTFGGGTLVTKGILTGDDLTIGISALMTIFGIAWSVFQKVKK